MTNNKRIGGNTRRKKGGFFGKGSSFDKARKAAGGFMEGQFQRVQNHAQDFVEKAGELRDHMEKRARGDHNSVGDRLRANVDAAHGTLLSGIKHLADHKDMPAAAKTHLNNFHSVVSGMKPSSSKSTLARMGSLGSFTKKPSLTRMGSLGSFMSRKGGYGSSKKKRGGTKKKCGVRGGYGSSKKKRGGNKRCGHTKKKRGHKKRPHKKSGGTTRKRRGGNCRKCGN